MMSRVLFPALSAAVLVCAALAYQAPATGAQPPASQPNIPASALAMLPKPSVNDTLHIQNNIGSFKILPRGDAIPAGRLEFSFKGTVLLTGVAPGSFVQTSGSVQKEYDSNDKHGKQVYFGSGKILVVGKFRNCEWFGRDLNLIFKGFGIVRMFSEFDKNGDIGNFWFDPSQKLPLMVNMVSTEVPSPIRGQVKAITREEFEKQQKQQPKQPAGQKKIGS